MYNGDYNAVFILLGIVCAVVGWGVIESVLWLLSHVSVSWAW